MLRVLYKLYESKSFVSIYTSLNESSKFYYGRIIAVDESEIAIQMLHPSGADDGIVVMSVDDVLRVEENSQYSNKMQKLFSVKSIPNYDFPINENGIMFSVLNYAFLNNQIVSLELLNSGIFDVVGYVTEIDENVCVIKQVDEYGFDDGISYLEWLNITMLSVLSEDEKTIMRLRTSGDASVACQTGK